MENDTKQKILKLSKILFYENGYSNTTIKQIADEVGISSSVLFHHFENKRDILIHVINEYDDRRREIANLFGSDLSFFDRIVLNSKMYLVPSANDKKLARLHVDEFNENLATNIGPSNQYKKSLLSCNIDINKCSDKSLDYDELMKYRLFYYRGALKETMENFVNGNLEFNEKSIDDHIISCFNLFFNKPIDEILSSIKKANRIMSLISFNGLEITVLNDKISEYISASKDFAMYDQIKVVLIDDIVFTIDINLNANDIDNNIKWLKEQFNKVVILTKNYELNNPADLTQIILRLDDFRIHILKSLSSLHDKFTQDFFAASFIDKDKLKEYKGLIKQFEAYGIDAVKTLRNLDMYYNDEDNVITHCAFIFY
ncbi:DNA-binding transcriptional repressor AcrR [Oxobacter pfennigii]|uniref:DNA-binding transcriptional repressor AcrR n=1 Tax=Oxobacter pfennigii TaxID=36849 RepID=A0A0N8NTB9_9CLOT|nr:TetR/AcrR family transcriptional regulator [Oxobacter pfennigii]KPU44400.1 DNA-binding transcriptional repressor AcrR [Oxobacter pfennigii]